MRAQESYSDDTSLDVKIHGEATGGNEAPCFCSPGQNDIRVKPFIKVAWHGNNDEARAALKIKLFLFISVYE